MNNSSKNHAIRQLFQDNRNELIAADVTTPVKKNGVCYDGIINEADFENCRSLYGANVVFLLKEANGNTRTKQNDGSFITKLPEVLEDWDYRGWLEHQQSEGKDSADPNCSKQFYGSAFNKLCMWTDLFYDTMGEQVLPFSSYEKDRYNEANFRNVLKRTGIVNLKKTWGSGKTEWQHLASYLGKIIDSVPQQVLRREMEIISPSAVICGSRVTFDFAQKVFNGLVCKAALPDGKTFDHFEKNGTIYIDFHHPSCRGSNEALYHYAQVRFAALKTLLKA